MYLSVAATLHSHSKEKLRLLGPSEKQKEAQEENWTLPVQQNTRTSRPRGTRAHPDNVRPTLHMDKTQVHQINTAHLLEINKDE